MGTHDHRAPIRPAWCYGTAGVARALFLAGQALERPDWWEDAEVSPDRVGLLDAPPPGRPDRIALRPGTWPVIAEPEAMTERPETQGRGEVVRIEAGGRAFHVAPEVADACRRLLDVDSLPVEALSADPVDGARIAEVLLGLGLCMTSPH